MLSHSNHVWLFAILWSVACQARLTMGFSRQEYWSGLPYPPPGDFPNPGIKRSSLPSHALQSDSLLLSLQGTPYIFYIFIFIYLYIYIYLYILYWIYIFKPDNPNRNQPCIFIGRMDAEAEAPRLWLKEPPNWKSWLIAKDPDAGKDWGQEVKGTTEEEMVGWHH